MFNHMYVCLCTGICMWIQVPVEAKSIEFPGDTVTCSEEMPNMETHLGINFGFLEKQHSQ